MWRAMGAGRLATLENVSLKEISIRPVLEWCSSKIVQAAGNGMIGKEILVANNGTSTKLLHHALLLV